MKILLFVGLILSFVHRGFTETRIQLIKHAFPAEKKGKTNRPLTLIRTFQILYIQRFESCVFKKVLGFRIKIFYKILRF